MGKRVFWLGFVLSVWLGLSFLIPVPQAIASPEDKQLVSEAWRIVNQAYVDSSFNHQNWWNVRQKTLEESISDREEAYASIKKMLASLEDPFTRFLDPEQYRSLQVNTAGELSGVGLQIAADADRGGIEVIAPIDGSPAAAAGIQPRDRILAIDGISTQELSLDEAARKMRGTAGTSVTLTVQREAEDPQEIFLVRSRIALNPVFSALDTSQKNFPVGYIRLTQFSANATSEVSKAITNLQEKGAKSYILDLRNNPGGLLHAGIQIAKLWLNEGTVVYTVNRLGVIGSFEAEGEALTDAPLAILVNQGTASASEILAGALQDQGRAILIGEKTYGKGLIQSLFDLSDGSGMAVTVAKYETPNHHDIHKLGIMPDQVVSLEPITLDEVGTTQDTQYQAALGVLTGHSVVAAK